jgi:hypothetical protein
MKRSDIDRSETSERAWLQMTLHVTQHKVECRSSLPSQNYCSLDDIVLVWGIALFRIKCEHNNDNNNDYNLWVKKNGKEEAVACLVEATRYLETGKAVQA